jgi:hypothetical protein
MHTDLAPNNPHSKRPPRPGLSGHIGDLLRGMKIRHCISTKTGKPLTYLAIAKQMGMKSRSVHSIRAEINGLATEDYSPMSVTALKIMIDALDASAREYHLPKKTLKAMRKELNQHIADSSSHYSYYNLSEVLMRNGLHIGDLSVACGYPRHSPALPQRFRDGRAPTANIWKKVEKGLSLLSRLHPQCRELCLVTSEDLMDPKFNYRVIDKRAKLLPSLPPISEDRFASRFPAIRIYSIPSSDYLSR